MHPSLSPTVADLLADRARHARPRPRLERRPRRRLRLAWSRRRATAPARRVAPT
ncbi:MAG: hypothetical protein IRZ32_03475 [Solirubrobacteraceae bacterium]|nr:hypothetical protein [Solirubrobacteraceae bacterium]